MAKINDVLELFDNLNLALNEIRHSEAPELTRYAIIRAVNALSVSVKWGNSQTYVDTLIADFSDLLLVVNTPIADSVASDVNNDTQHIRNYFMSRWWQFAGDETREPIATIPVMTTLE